MTARLAPDLRGLLRPELANAEVTILERHPSHALVRLPNRKLVKLPWRAIFEQSESCPLVPDADSHDADCNEPDRCPTCGQVLERGTGA